MCKRLEQLFHKEKKYRNCKQMANKPLRKCPASLFILDG